MKVLKKIAIGHNMTSNEMSYLSGGAYELANNNDGFSCACTGSANDGSGCNNNSNHAAFCQCTGDAANTNETWFCSCGEKA